MVKARSEILTRLYVVLVVLALFPVFVAGKIVVTVTTEGPELRERGEKQASLFVEIPAVRGAILDRAGRVLAVNVARYELALDPTMPGFSEEAGSFFDRLSKLTGTSARTLERRVEDRSSKRYVLLARDLSESQKEEVESWNVPGLILTPDFARRYNYGPTGSHVLGHVDADGAGTAGLELMFDRYMRGIPGRRADLRDRLGTTKANVGGQVIEPKHGETLVLTIDLIRQTLMEDELARGVAEMGATWGTAIAMDPNTGAILAMANVPTYDPNRPGAYPVSYLKNHGVTDRIEPGSTFKLVTAAAALEEGKVDINEIIHTGDGVASFGGAPIRDSHPLGSVPFSEAIAQSSNVALAAVGGRLEPGILYRYARNMGFGQPTWIDMPGEVAGTLKKPESWSRTTHSRMSIGYEVDVTPIQILTAYSALANGGYIVHPHVVAERRDMTGRTTWAARPDTVRRAFTQETAEQLRPAFEKVVSDGTAEKAIVEGLPIAGKTGTARKATGRGYAAGLYRTTFVGYFPADRPAVAMIVVLDEPRKAVYGGTAAAPIFQKIARRWAATFPQIAERMAPSEKLPKAAPASGSARHVIRVAHLDGRPTVMPDLNGLSARQAAYRLRALGIETIIEGNGSVVSQSPAAGSTLPRKAVLRCR